MIRMIVRHPVRDYELWREGYDAGRKMRDEMGVTADAVYRGAEDANDVTVTHDFDTLDAARTFAGSEFLKQKMQELGVSGPAMLWFVRRAS
ncbi:cyclase [Stappia sp. F7233]|uniref:Cyclase n=1 Tax=Stappia albiluteola TaxID=2758565 RepID=A0A839AFY7_9HYPH|nr:cyclase [Stappia albiluteola]MBA5778571.1 cyclase [Stappia albiluteola]